MFYLQFSRPFKTLPNHQISNSYVSLSYYKAFKNQKFTTSAQYFNCRRKRHIYLLNYLIIDLKRIPYVMHPR